MENIGVISQNNLRFPFFAATVSLRSPGSLRSPSAAARGQLDEPARVVGRAELVAPTRGVSGGAAERATRGAVGSHQAQPVLHVGGVAVLEEEREDGQHPGREQHVDEVGARLQRGEPAADLLVEGLLGAALAALAVGGARRAAHVAHDVLVRRRPAVARVVVEGPGAEPRPRARPAAEGEGRHRRDEQPRLGAQVGELRDDEHLQPDHHVQQPDVRPHAPRVDRRPLVPLEHRGDGEHAHRQQPRLVEPEVRVPVQHVLQQEGVDVDLHQHQQQPEPNTRSWSQSLQ